MPERVVKALNCHKFFPMLIAVAGPYSAPTAEQRKANLDAMNEAAARILEKGHVPLIGVNAALPVLEKASVTEPYKAIMDISMSVIANCDALLLLAESPGANRERALIQSKGGIIYRTVEEIPFAQV
jgi:hypothetical protein